MFLSRANFLIHNCAGVVVRGLMSVWVGVGVGWRHSGEGGVGEGPAGISLLQE